VLPHHLFKTNHNDSRSCCWLLLTHFYPFVICNQSEWATIKITLEWWNTPNSCKSQTFHMNCNWLPFCCWINWHMPPQILDHHHPQLPTLQCSNQCVIGPMVFRWVTSKWELMKVWSSILERLAFMPHPKWILGQYVFVGLKVWLCYWSLSQTSGNNYTSL
jgi:hypothetical protein